LLDCCFAEKVVENSRFFTRLDGSKARLFICSSRASQRTWEEDKLGHGVFSANLVEILRGDRSEQINVESELFPQLCERVPLQVFN